MLKTRETKVEERKEEKRSEKRDRILRAAEAIFLDKGFHAASMNEIAEAADVTARLISTTSMPVKPLWHWLFS